MSTKTTLKFWGTVALLLVAADAFAAPVLRYQTDLHGDLVVFGNTLGRDCGNSPPAPVVGTVGSCGNSTGDTSIDIFWRSDSPADGQAEANNGVTVAQARSQAVFQLPVGATVAYARAYWSAKRSSANADTTATLTAPDGTTLALSADQSWTGSSGGSNFYQSTDEVTDFLKAQGTGAYTMSGVDVIGVVNQDDETAYAGWTIVVAYSLPTAPPRNIAIFDGFDRVSSSGSASGSISGFEVPASGYDAKLFMVTYEGDASINGDAFQFNGNTLSNALNPSNNFFNGTRSTLGVGVSVDGDLPQLTGAAGSMAGMDIDVLDVTDYVTAGATSATFQATSSQDLYYLGVFGTSISTYAPNFVTTNKTMELLDPTPVTPGDRIRYTIVVPNTGNDPAVNTILEDPLPAGVALIPGTLQIVSGANAGMKTDAAGDDQAEYVEATHMVRVRLGTGANAVSGGTMGLGESTTVTFDVEFTGNTAGLFSNQVFIRASGQSGAPQTDWNDNTESVDPDTDGDGLLDSEEGTCGLDPLVPDSDSDGIPDFVETDGGTCVDTDLDLIIDALDLDSDGDLVLDSVEGTADFDLDTLPNWRDADDDNDTLLTLTEVQDSGLVINVDGTDGDNWFDIDADGDGKLDSVELRNDVDGDNVWDYLDVDETDGPLADKDGDGILNGVDNCIDIPNTDQANNDGDSQGDVCDDDDDNDDVPDVDDNCPITANTDQADQDGDGPGDVCDPDRDGDELPNGDDNCPNVPNPDQADLDADGVGDLCDNDIDGDGILNPDDNCPVTFNTDQADLDGDGFGDVCDDDIDGDGFENVIDNCPTTPSVDLADGDQDGLGNACDDDWDNDGTPNILDNCPLFASEDFTDTDEDGFGDVCDDDLDNDGILNPVDNCLTTPNVGQSDVDADGLGDACDDDADNDTVPNDQDNCVLVPNTDQLDTDDNGVGDLCEGDLDGDGVLDPADNCPVVPNASQSDLDNDGLGDACDDDLDGDGIPNLDDNCPLTANLEQLDSDTDGLGDVCDDDVDGDGIGPDQDNCPEVYNPNQWDTDQDGIGDLCDNDIDDDGIENGVDNCPLNYNPGQEDLNLDGWGDACQELPDTDQDGILDVLDNCPTVPNEDQADSDGNGIGDLCEPSLDQDEDGIPDMDDNCPTVANFDQVDSDQDGLGDVCDDDDDNDEIPDVDDNCPLVANPNQEDSNEDGFGDACQDDWDGDGVLNDDDNCPVNPNTNQLDSDQDGAGDACDDDDDNDGVKDVDDNCATTANADQADLDEDGLGDLCDADDDNDGIDDIDDNCPVDANDDQADLDSDNLGDVCDADDDGDGVLDPDDNCPLVQNPNQADEDNDGIGDACQNDWDGDGVLNDDDNCPKVANTDQADLDDDGLGNVCDLDDDDDGVADNDDNCPAAANTDQLDSDNDGIGDVCDEPIVVDDDVDGDGVSDLDDNCPEVANTDQKDTDNDDIGDVCDADMDNDDVPNLDDNCPVVPNTDQDDLDGNGVGDACQAGGVGIRGGACSAGAAPVSSNVAWLFLVLTMTLLLMRRRMAWAKAAVRVVPFVLALVVLLPATARAETSIDAQAFKPSPFHQDLFVTGQGHTRGQMEWNVGLFLDYQNDPIVIKNLESGDVVRTVIGNQLTATLMAGFGIFDWLDVGAALPVVMFQDGQGFVGQDAPSPVGLGDLRIYPRLQVYRTENKVFSLAFSPSFSIPTANTIDPYKGNKSFTFTPWVNLDVNLKVWGATLNLGYLVTANEQVGDLKLQDELQYHAGVWYSVVPELAEVIVEMVGSTAASEPFGNANQNPLEFLVGGKYHLSANMAVSLGGGVGITEGYSSPDFRLFGGFMFNSKVEDDPNKDRDQDGIPDKADSCPDDPEDIDKFQDQEGCPDWDNDKDGICDRELPTRLKGDPAVACSGVDKCPDDPEDKDQFEDGDGCPDVDNDSDGVCDAWVAEKGQSASYQSLCKGSDKCPLEKEDIDQFEDLDGCPDPDNDKDGFCDPWVAQGGGNAKFQGACAKGVDKCPNEPETLNGRDDTDGCPDELAKVQGKNIVIIETILFYVGTDKIKPESQQVVDAVYKVLLENPGIKKLRVDGHTDSRDNARKNLELSQKRAAAVVKALVARGIDAKRLDSKGFGEEQLLVKPETTEADYQKNRRVEFTIMERAGP